MTIAEDDQLRTAIRVVRENGLDIVLAERYKNLQVWLNAGNKGWPPPGWTPNAMQLHSVERCADLKITQAQGEMACCRMPGHDGKHYCETTGERWE